MKPQIQRARPREAGGVLAPLTGMHHVQTCFPQMALVVLALGEGFRGGLKMSVLWPFSHSVFSAAPSSTSFNPNPKSPLVRHQGFCISDLKSPRDDAICVECCSVSAPG